MKKPIDIKICLATATFIVLIALLSCRDGSVYTRSKIWAHRTNTPEEVNKKSKKFKGIEVDLFYDALTGNILVKHDIDAINPITFREFLGKIKKPHKLHYWLDIKNLNVDPETICDSIISITSDFDITNKYFIESWYADALICAKDKGVYTSLWIYNLLDMNDLDTLAWYNMASKKITMVQPDAISADYHMYELLVKFFPDYNIHLWQTPAEYNDYNIKTTKKLCDDDHVKIVLVDYPEPIRY